MSPRFDAIVIGSGFGGAVTACRVAEKGMKVLVLERGRRWLPRDYPRRAGDPWLFSSERPALHNGWLDFRFFPNMTVAQAAGVGGGSLAYSSVALEAHASLFANGWPTEIPYDELKPSYDRVTQMMNLQVVPDGQLTQRFKLAREAAQSDASFALVLCDMDNLKRVNDTLGHEAGDLALRLLADALRTGLRRDDAYRLGGDEFAVVLAGASLYIYLVHWEVWPLFEGWYGLPSLVASLLAGIALWVVATRGPRLIAGVRRS